MLHDFDVAKLEEWSEKQRSAADGATGGAAADDTTNFVHTDLKLGDASRVYKFTGRIVFHIRIII